MIIEIEIEMIEGKISRLDQRIYSYFKLGEARMARVSLAQKEELERKLETLRRTEICLEILKT